MVNGYMGRRLRVDLSNDKHKIESLSPTYLKKWMGGRGFNSETVYHETEQGLDPLSPENVLCFGTGALAGTWSPLSGRTTVTARSPMTCSIMGTDVHALGDTNMGGQFAAYMKYAGFDQIVVKGRAEKPVWLWIDDMDVEIRPAEHLWGREVKESQKIIIKEEIGDPDMRVLNIGPAGENLVRYACVVNSYSSAGGRTGMGAVMGSKNLKAIGVRGKQEVTFANPEEFAEEGWELRERVHNSPSAKRRQKEGSMDLFDAGNAIGINAHKNVSTGFMPGLEETYGGEKWAKNWLFRRKGCWSCPVSCGRYTYHDGGKYEGFHAGGPEMETVCNLGPRLDTYDVETVNVLSGLVNELGMDSISAGGAISWAMEAYEKGLLTKEDTNGLEFKWGDVETAMDVLNMIANREGFGDILAEGAIRAAKKIGKGTEKLVPHNRGLEHISVDPRIALGFSLGYAMSTRGSDHLRNYSVLEFPGAAQSREELVNEALEDEELIEKFWDDFPSEMSEMDTKPKLCTYSERNKLVADLVGACCQAIGSWGGAGDWRSYTPLYRLATGFEDMTNEKIWKVAERVNAIERALWNREGSGWQDDWHIDRYYDQPVEGGPHKGLKLDRDEWAWAQETYYKLHGWDEDGFITPEKAKELDIEEIIPDVEKGKEIYEEYMSDLKERAKKEEFKNSEKAFSKTFSERLS